MVGCNFSLKNNPSENFMLVGKSLLFFFFLSRYVYRYCNFVLGKFGSNKTKFFLFSYPSKSSNFVFGSDLLFIWASQNSFAEAIIEVKW